VSAIPFVILLVGVGFAAGAALGAVVTRSGLHQTPMPVLVALAAWGAVGGVLASGRPTALEAFDAAARAAFAALVVLVGARARRRSLTIAAAALAVPTALAAESAGLPAWLVGTAVATGAASLAGWLWPDRVPILGGLIGLGTSLTALRLPTTMPTYVPTALAALAAAVLTASTARNLRTRLLKRVRTAAVGIGGLAFLASVAGSIALINARAQAERGLDAARAGLAAARAGETTSAEADFTTAASALRLASERLRSPMARAGLVVPVLSQHIAVIRDLTSTASGVVDTARDTADQADLESLRSEGARIDVARMRELRGQVVRADDAIGIARAAIAQASSPWLVPAVRARITSLGTQVDLAAASTADARRILDHVPPMLGADRPRRYLLVLPTPAEARGSGGVIGNFGEITAVGGKLELVRFGRTPQLAVEGLPFDRRRLEAPEDWAERYVPFGAPGVWSNLTMSPDFPTTAAVLADQYPQSGGLAVDGVLSADPVALGALLRVLGPLQVTNWPDPLTADNTAPVLLHEAYVSKGGDSPERRALLSEVTQAAWAKLSTATIPSPKALIDALAPAVRTRHLQLWMRDPAEQAYLASIGIAGTVPPLAGDGLGVVVNNASESKIDWYLHRAVDTDIVLDPRTGRVRSTVSVTLRNDAPAGGLNDYVLGAGRLAPVGAARHYVSIYSPLPLLGGDLDGKPVNVAAQQELGRNVYSVWMTIPAGSSSTLRLGLAGEVTGARDRYRLDVFTPAGVNPDRLRVTLRTLDTSPLRPRDGFTAPGDAGSNAGSNAGPNGGSDAPPDAPPEPGWARDGSDGVLRAEISPEAVATFEADVGSGRSTRR
jgi:hypothetical protein